MWGLPPRYALEETLQAGKSFDWMPYTNKMINMYHILQVKKCKKLSSY